MQVILIDDVFELGRRGEVVKVSPGFGRNYLIPRQLAIPATPGNLKMIEQQRVTMAKKEAKYKEEAELLAEELGRKHLLISRKAGDTGVLFGSVTSKDVGDVLEANGIHLDRRRILLSQPIKNIGTYRIQSRPHAEVDVELLLSVIPEGDEPVTRLLERGEESDKILHDLEEKVREAEQLSGAGRGSGSPLSPSLEAEDRRRSRKPREARAEEVAAEAETEESKAVTAEEAAVAPVEAEEE